MGGSLTKLRGSLVLLKYFTLVMALLMLLLSIGIALGLFGEGVFSKSSELFFAFGFIFVVFLFFHIVIQLVLKFVIGKMIDDERGDPFKF